MRKASSRLLPSLIHNNTAFCASPRILRWWLSYLLPDSPLSPPAFAISTLLGENVNIEWLISLHIRQNSNGISNYLRGLVMGWNEDCRDDSFFLVHSSVLLLYVVINEQIHWFKHRKTILIRERIACDDIIRSLWMIRCLWSFELFIIYSWLWLIHIVARNWRPSRCICISARILTFNCS